MLFRQFSFPGGIPSHAAPETPGSIHEGGELGYALAHAFGAAFDNPDLLVACVVGDGEAETGPLAASWHSNKFLNPRTDGAVLPILHLNGYKIANPTVLARIPEHELRLAVRGLRLASRCSSRAGRRGGADSPSASPQPRRGPRRHRSHSARSPAPTGPRERPRWPMIVLRTPKGWTGRRRWTANRSRARGASHQVPLADVRDNPSICASSRSGCASYRPEELFDETGALVPELAELAPRGDRRMSANPHANGGLLLRRSRAAGLPRLRGRGVAPGQRSTEATRVLGAFLRDMIAAQPDELPPLRPGRDGIEPARRRLRGHRTRVGRRDRADRRESSPTVG